MKRSEGFKLLLFPLVLLLLDLIFRWDRFTYFHAAHVYFYCISCFTSVIFHTMWLLILKQSSKNPWYFFPLGFIYFLLTLCVVGASLAFKNINDLFPNYYTLLYFKTEPKSAFMIIRDVCGWRELTILMLAIGLLTWLSRNIITKHIPSTSTKGIIIIGLIALTLFEGLVAKHKKFDQCAIVDVNFCACIQRHLVTWDDHATFKGKGLGIRKVTVDIKDPKPAPFNVLIIVCESFRKKSLSLYGNPTKTTPLLDAFIQSHPESSTVFKEPFTVSTTTMLAVPATLSGIGPYQDSSLLYTQPLIWDYAKQFNYKRFFLSSHTLEWYRFADFYKNDSLDVWWNHDNSGKPYFNDLGIRDEITIDKTIATLNAFKNNPFTGVIQLNTTHYPYRVPEKYNRWNTHYRDSYNNSVWYQDAILGKLFTYLKRSNKLKNTVIILTSDHGESLMEHHNIGHVESNYYETISIPLIAYIPPKLLTAKQRHFLKQNSTKLTSNIDIVPTLIDLWNLQNHPSWTPYTTRLTGYSLLGEIPKNRALITLNNNQIASFNTGLSLINNEFHFLLRTNLTPPKIEWYKRSDTQELHDCGPFLPHQMIDKIKQTIKPFPICNPFLDYLNSSSFKSTNR